MATFSDIVPPQIGKISSKSSITLTENGAKETVTLLIHLKRMTRKRAVKLLMSSGLDRNGAAALTRMWGGRYTPHMLLFWLNPPAVLLDKANRLRARQCLK